MEDELRQIVRSLGWNLFKRVKKNRDYFYAQKWKKGEVYITSQTNLPRITREQVLEKIARAEAS